MKNQTVSIDLVAMLDEVVGELYASADALKVVFDLRKRYECGPDADWPAEATIYKIFDECLTFVNARYADSRSHRLWPLFQPEFMFRDLANCLAKFAVSGLTDSLESSFELEKMFQSARSSPPRKGRRQGSTDKRKRAALLDGHQRGLDLEEIALEWWENHSEDFEDVDDAIAVKRIREQFRKLWTTLKPEE